MTTPSVTPWWQVLSLRREIAEGGGAVDDVQMSLFNAVHGAAGVRPLYADAAYYGEITHPSPNLTGLLASVALRLTGSSAAGGEALWRLDQSMGGGKSHGLIGLWHLAEHPALLRETDIGSEVFAEADHRAKAALPADLGQPQVVVLACDNMTAGAPDQKIDGPARTLHERFLWRLFGGDYTLFQRYRQRRDKDELAAALTAVGRPVLILVDEILDYVRQLSRSDLKDLAVDDMTFLRALLDAVNDVPRVAMVVVMIASESDSIDLDAEGRNRRAELDDLLVRNGKTATVTAAADFAAILRRRLLQGQVPHEVIEATTRRYLETMVGPWTEKVFRQLPRAAVTDFTDEVARCYPFHPALIDLAEREWAPIAGFQKVRSTIRIFAATLYALNARARAGEWAPPLIGPGDLPLSVPTVREAIIGSGLIADQRTQANYRQLAATDIVNEADAGGAARELDAARGETPYRYVNPRPAERMATALFLFSVIGSRSQGRRGATEAELKAASFVPNRLFTLSEAEVVLADLCNPETGLAALERTPGRGGEPARLFLSTRQTLQMLVRGQRAAVTDLDRDAELARAAERLANTGPFKAKRFVEAKDAEEDSRLLHTILETSGIDDARSTRLVILDPRRFSLLNGADTETRSAIRAAMGIGGEKMAMQWAPSAVFVVINTQRRASARSRATEYLAWQRVSEIDAVRLDEELKLKAADEIVDAKGQFDRAIRQAYQHILYVAPGVGGEGRRDETIRLEDEKLSALDGSVVWKKLVEAGRALDSGDFDAPAFLHNLLATDYNRPLDEVRDLFWNTARMPLLPEGEQDLRRAIYQAVREGRLRIVGADGTDREITGPEDIPIGSTTARLGRPLPPASQEDAVWPTAGAGNQPARVSEPGTATYSSDKVIAAATEVQVSFTVNTGLTDVAQRDALFKLLDGLAVRIDDGKASHIQLVVKAVVPEDVANQLQDLARNANVSVQIVPL